MIVAPDFAVAADLSIPPDLSTLPDLSSTDAFTCPGPLITPIPIYLGCGQGAIVNVQIKNPCPNGMNLTITAISLSGMDAGAFKLENVPALPVSVPQGAGFAIDVSVVMQQQPQELNAQLDVISNGAPVSIPLHAGPPSLTIMPQAVDFGKQQVGVAASPHTVALTNGGNCPLHVTGLTFIGPNPGDFGISGAVVQMIAPNGGTGVLQILFTPTGVGARSATMQVVSDDPQGIRTVMLSGTGF